MTFTFTVGGSSYNAPTVSVTSSTSATVSTPAVLAIGTAIVSATNSSAASQTNSTFTYTAVTPSVTSRGVVNMSTLAAVAPARFFRHRPDYSPLVFGFANAVAREARKHDPEAGVVIHKLRGKSKFKR